MDKYNSNKKESLELAKKTSNTDILIQLAEHTETLIRRAVARNTYTPSWILKKLAHDPVLNISYMAVKNPNSNYKRKFLDISHPCVKCEVDERDRDCNNCKELFSFINNS